MSFWCRRGISSLALGVLISGFWLSFAPAAPALISATAESSTAIIFSFNPLARRVEVRDELGNVLQEIPMGSVLRTVKKGAAECQLSCGKDEFGRISVLVRPGPTSRQPMTIELLGRKAVLSPEASLLATMADQENVFFEPSICGEVYYLDGADGAGNKISRRAAGQREVAVLAKPSSSTGQTPRNLEDMKKSGEEMDKAGQAFKSAVFAVFGLPDKEQSGKAKVYRLRRSSSPETSPEAAPPVSAEAGRPQGGS